MIGEQIGSYRIIEAIGQGGMSTVYRAVQTTVDRDVAIKVIEQNIARDATSLERFRREARLVARLEHPHILPLHDFDGTHDPPYIVMRLLEGGTLRDMMTERRLTFHEIATIMQQIGSALDYAHRQGIVHRDIKPSNIMFDNEGNAFVTDFGIAFVAIDDTRTHLTRAGSVVGTPDFMSPEQGMGQKFDHRADIYAIGVMLYFILSGKLPYHDSNPVALILKHRDEPIPKVTDQAPNLPPVLNDVIAKAMAKDPDRRYYSMSELVNDFVKSIGGTPTSSGGIKIGGNIPHTAVAGSSVIRELEGQTMSDESLMTPTEQNKIVTVMYVIASEYGEIIEALEGSEAAYIVMNVMSDSFQSIVHEHGGVIFQRHENTLLAIWGSEYSREDDSEQAVRAALAIQDMLRMMGAQVLSEEGEDEPLPLNIGIHTGSVLLTTDEKGEAAASGATVNLTARLAQRAEGTILLTQNTYRVVQNQFSFEREPRSIRVRGHKQNLEVYRLTGVKQQVQGSSIYGIEGVETPLIGRDIERKTLEESFLAAIEDHETQLVTILGDMGMGKSRLVYEFMQWVHEQATDLVIFQARALLDTNRAYSLLREFIAKHLEIYDLSLIHI
ncbi:MAG: protein kinase, partial [Chloroflexi bacterium]|nr:protein kinase [Chloroflexota bacterium]